ncbi:hypothetical protein LSAT2_002986 [Lamellibrachia satsuma]|nr:hypothetical protein LSAT2_002986 [Lamellibrachia satsuma]
MKLYCLVALLAAVCVGVALSSDTETSNKTTSRCHIYCWWDKWKCVRTCFNSGIAEVTSSPRSFGQCYRKCRKTEKSCIKTCKD